MRRYMVALAFRYPQHHALAWLHAKRLAVAQGAAIDGEEIVSDVDGIVIHGAGPEVRIPFFERQENLLIVVAGLARRIDVQEAELAGVGGALQISFGFDVRVIPARSAWRG